MRALMAALAALFILSVLSPHPAIAQGERMPALFRYEKAHEIYSFACGEPAVRVVFYNEINGADSPTFKAIAIYIRAEARRVITYISDDSSDEDTAWTAYIDLDRNGTVDRTERRPAGGIGPDHACPIIAEAQRLR